jgi:hypothetical protein
MSFAHPRSLAAVVMLAAAVSVAHAAQVKVSVTNNAPSGGTYLTPAWVGFHDGTFDTFTAGSPASAGLEAIAEDGNAGPLSGLFAGAGIDGVVGGAPIAPGASTSAMFDLNADGSHNYLSFASMVLASSDFFIGNDNPLAASIAGVLGGSFKSVSFTVAKVYDAGTEINDFATSAGNGLFGIPGGQTGPNQGATQNGVVALASGGDFAAFLNAGGVNVGPLNFDNYVSLATIEVSAVPIPAALPLMLSSILGLGVVMRRRVGLT